jgi:hypothetical protein
MPAEVFTFARPTTNRGFATSDGKTVIIPAGKTVLMGEIGNGTMHLRIDGRDIYVLPFNGGYGTWDFGESVDMAKR